MQSLQSFRVRIAAVVLTLALVAPFAQAQTKIKSGFNMFSPEQDAQIGAQSAAEAERQLPLVNNDRVENFVSQIGERLAAQAPGPKFDYRFKVINASDLNAFALPGGYIYLNRGIVEAAKNEGEVAGVLAHEIAHVALRHGTHNASKAHLTQAGIGILGGLLGQKVGGGQSTAQIINAVGGFGLNVLFLKYTREAEKDADLLGAQILAKAGYNPQDMVSFFETLAKTDTKKRPPTWLTSHPAPADRIGSIQKEARLLGVTPRATTRASDLTNVQASLRNMGTAPSMQQIAQGTASRPATRSSSGAQRTIRVAAPSTTARAYTAQTGLYRISYPSNWRVYESGSNGVTIAPEGGAFDNNGRAEIVYGAIINHYDPFQNDTRSRRNATTLEQATDDLVAQISQSSGYLKPVRGSGKRIKLDGGNALAATLVGKSPLTGQNERVTIVSRGLDDDHLIYMLFITPEKDAKAYNGVLNSMVSSMQVDPGHRH
jgi:Zn-dependent protease with chaperone function